MKKGKNKPEPLTGWETIDPDGWETIDPEIWDTPIPDFPAPDPGPWDVEDIPFNEDDMELFRITAIKPGEEV
jgi:hypothetical protein